MTEILIATGVVAGVGIILGLFLGIAGKIFYVKQDDRITRVRENLPGSNCGGCGFSGCDAMAEQIVKNGVKPNKCAGCDSEHRAEISKIMGIEDEAAERMVAVVKCSGTCDKTNFVYNYYGINECHRVVLIPGRGSKACAYSCTGLGSCVRACPTGAIRVINGKAAVDREKCIGCSACIRACPNGLIELVPYASSYVVMCRSQEKGKSVRDMCAAGCIGCGICQKFCPTKAITLTNNIAHIDQSLCEGCGVCASKCPAKIIKFTGIKKNEK